MTGPKWAYRMMRRGRDEPEPPEWQGWFWLLVMVAGVGLWLYFSWQ